MNKGYDKKHLQRIFNKAVEGLAKQGFVRAVGIGKTEHWCFYRTKSGLRCAIGHAMSERNSRTNGIDNMPLSEVCNHIPLAGKRFILDYSPASKRFWVGLLSLREAHDLGTTPSEMRENLVSFAARYKLDLPEVLREEA